MPTLGAGAGGAPGSSHAAGEREGTGAEGAEIEENPQGENFCCPSLHVLVLAWVVATITKVIQ